MECDLSTFKFSCRYKVTMIEGFCMSLKEQTTGFIGLGAMGRGMAANCQKKGFNLMVNDIAPDPVDYLTGLGATAAQTPAEVARQCPVVVTCLPSGARRAFHTISCRSAQSLSLRRALPSR